MEQSEHTEIDIPMTAVDSSQINAIGYHAPSQTLRVQFKGGSQYDYTDVPADAHEAFGKAESLGKHFGAHIKNKFGYRKLPAKKAHG